MEEESQTSTITFGTETKRRREETEIESNFRCLRPRNFRCLRPRNFWCLRLRCKQFREMPVNIDVGYLFAQLGLVRYKRKPYDKFEGLDDIKLWVKILEVLCTNLIHEPTLDELVEVFKVYELKYNQNPSLPYMRDPDLRGNILTVFEQKSDNIGVPFIPANLEELIARKKEIAKSQEIVKPLKFDPYSLIQLSNSSDCSLEVVYPPDRSGIEAIIKNLEDKKELANKYCQDALEIGVDPSEMGPLLSKYPPDSCEYLVANSMQDDDMRRKTFQSMHENCLKESSQSKKSSQSSKQSSSSVRRKQSKDTT